MSSNHVWMMPGDIYPYMKRAENLLDNIQKGKLVGCFYNALDSAYNSLLLNSFEFYTVSMGAYMDETFLGRFESLLMEFEAVAKQTDGGWLKAACVDLVPLLEKTNALRSDASVNPHFKEFTGSMSGLEICISMYCNS
jgi:hypothetical protein